MFDCTHNTRFANVCPCEEGIVGGASCHTVTHITITQSHLQSNVKLALRILEWGSYSNEIGKCLIPFIIIHLRLNNVQQSMEKPGTQAQLIKTRILYCRSREKSVLVL